MKNIFNSKLKNDSFSDLISAGMTMTGDIEFAGHLKIEGTVSGTHILSSMFLDRESEDTSNRIPDGLTHVLSIEEGAVVYSSTIKSANIIIGGTSVAKVLHAEKTMRIFKTAVIRDCTIYYRLLEIEPGAVLINCELRHLDHFFPQNESLDTESSDIN